LLWTDLQVLTDPRHPGLYSGGNLSSVVEDYPSTHRCNVFCELLDLNPFSGDRSPNYEEDLPGVQVVRKIVRPADTEKLGEAYGAGEEGGKHKRQRRATPKAAAQGTKPTRVGSTSGSDLPHAQ
jgi:hypothetical protein